MKIINEVKQSLVERWEKAPRSLSVANIKDKYIKANTAKLLENQRAQSVGLITEDFSTGVSGPTGLNQGIPNGGDGKGVFAPISMALVRRVFPQLFANVLVGVQPMNGPVGLAFALRNIYKTSNPDEIIEAAWKSVPEFAGFTGSTANTSGKVDAGTGVETEAAEHWKLGGQADKFEKMPELGLMLSRQPVVSKTRKLGASFSIESAEDIKRMQGIDMMSEIVKTIQYEMTAEIDRETIAHCKNLCTPQTFTKAPDSATDGWTGRWSQERFSNIVTLIVSASNQIRTATRRAAANIAVVSPNIATILQASAPFFNKIVTNVNGSAATPEIGTLNGTIKVYCDQNAVSRDGTSDNGEVLLAYKGEGINDCGVVYCPYVTGVVNQAIDPRDFSPRIGVMSRYAFADNMLGAENYYRLLKFDGLDTVLTNKATW